MDTRPGTLDRRQFLWGASASAALLAAGPTAWAAGPPRKPTGFEAAAARAFQRLRERWEESPSWWQAGNALDTLADFLALSGAHPGDLPAAALSKYRAGGRERADDPGWWGLAVLKLGSLRAVRVRGGHGAWLAVAEGCWQQLCREEPAAGRREPRFGSCAGPGRRTAAASGLRLALSARLHRATGAPGPGAAATREAGWLRERLRSGTGEEPLLIRHEDGTALVRETEGGSPHTAWAGDQGLVLAALADWLRARPAEEAARDVARAVAEGVRTRMTREGILRPWIPQGLLEPWAPPGPAVHGPVHRESHPEPGDYECGPGVFFRAVTHAAHADPGLARHLRSPGYRAFVRAHAEAAAAPGDGNLSFWMNRLAALNAALAVPG